ncbi:hypothetical protein [Crossiella sp. CA198]|uniref:hypothetical protein n=1 Tax=Crossiella sp. CA198 TaxID=3455607 RepID=UPI003F8D0AAE
MQQPERDLRRPAAAAQWTRAASACLICSTTSAGSPDTARASDSVGPGATALTRTRSAASSRAQLRQCGGGEQDRRGHVERELVVDRLGGDLGRCRTSGAQIPPSRPG